MKEVNEINKMKNRHHRELFTPNYTHGHIKSLAYNKNTKEMDSIIKENLLKDPSRVVSKQSNYKMTVRLSHN